MRTQKKYEYIKEICWDHNFQVKNNILTKERKLIEDIMEFMEKMDPEYAELIRKEFIELGKDKTWWENKYASATFFRMKNKSTDIFLDLYYKYASKYR